MKKDTKTGQHSHWEVGPPNILVVVLLKLKIFANVLQRKFVLLTEQCFFVNIKIQITALCRNFYFLGRGCLTICKTAKTKRRVYFDVKNKSKGEKNWTRDF